MGLRDYPHQYERRIAGLHSRVYLPHFDGIATPQFITIHLADAIPRKVIDLKEYFDRYFPNVEHCRKTVQYIENNQVKAPLCEQASDWPLSSAWCKKRK